MLHINQLVTTAWEVAPIVISTYLLIDTAEFRDFCTNNLHVIVVRHRHSSKLNNIGWLHGYWKHKLHAFAKCPSSPHGHKHGLYLRYENVTFIEPDMRLPYKLSWICVRWQAACLLARWRFSSSDGSSTIVRRKMKQELSYCWDGAPYCTSRMFSFEWGNLYLRNF